jgi:hypothetical protein
MFRGISKYKTCFVFIPSFLAGHLMIFPGTLGVRKTLDDEQLCNVKGQRRSEDVMI